MAHKTTAQQSSLAPTFWARPCAAGWTDPQATCPRTTYVLRRVSVCLRRWAATNCLSTRAPIETGAPDAHPSQAFVVSAEQNLVCLAVSPTSNIKFSLFLGARDAYLIVTQCEDGSFCCGEKNDTCCAPRTGLYLSRDGRTVLPNPNLSSTTYVCSTINLKVGFGISVGLLGLGLCALGVFAVLQRRKIVVHGPKKEASVAHEGTIRGAGVEPAKDGAIPYEMAAREYIRELQ